MTGQKTSPQAPSPHQAMALYRDIIMTFDEANPMLTMGFDDNTIGFMDLLDIGKHPTDSLRIIVENYEMGNIPDPGWPVWALVSADSYATTAESAEGHYRGLLEERFLAGDPTVSECAMSSMIHRDGHAYFVNQHYRRNADHRVVEWGEIEIIEDPDYFATDTQRPHVQGDMAYWLARLVRQ